MSRNFIKTKNRLEKDIIVENKHNCLDRENIYLLKFTTDMYEFSVSHIHSIELAPQDEPSML